MVSAVKNPYKSRVNFPQVRALEPEPGKRPETKEASMARYSFKKKFSTKCKCGRKHDFSRCPNCKSEIFDLKPHEGDQRCKTCKELLQRDGKFQCDGYIFAEMRTCKELIPVIAVHRPIAARWHGWRDRHPRISYWMFPIVLFSILGVLLGLGLLGANYLQNRSIDQMALNAPIILRAFVRDCARDVVPEYLEQAKPHIRESDYETLTRQFDDYLNKNESTEYTRHSNVLPGGAIAPRVELLTTPFVLLGDIQQAMWMQTLRDKRNLDEMLDSEFYQELGNLRHLFVSLHRSVRSIETFYYGLVFDEKVYRQDWMYKMNINYHQLLMVYKRVLQSGDYVSIHDQIETHYRAKYDSGEVNYIRWDRSY
jgi:hypothetical protein